MEDPSTSGEGLYPFIDMLSQQASLKLTCYQLEY